MTNMLLNESFPQLQASASGPEASGALLRALAAEDAGASADWLASSAFTHEHGAWLDSQGLSPFAFYRLKQTGLLSRLPAAEQADLRAAFVRTLAANLLALEEARAWAGRFAEADINAVWLKGVPLSLTVDPVPGARPMGDIDVLLPQAQVKPAMALLEAVSGAPPAYLSTDIEARVRLGSRGQVRMDVHWDLLPPLHLRRRSDVEWFFGQQQTVVSEGGVHALALSPPPRVAGAVLLSLPLVRCAAGDGARPASWGATAGDTSNATPHT